MFASDFSKKKSYGYSYGNTSHFLFLPRANVCEAAVHSYCVCLYTFTTYVCTPRPNNAGLRAVGVYVWVLQSDISGINTIGIFLELVFSQPLLYFHDLSLLIHVDLIT